MEAEALDYAPSSGYQLTETRPEERRGAQRTVAGELLRGLELGAAA